MCYDREKDRMCFIVPEEDDLRKKGEANARCRVEKEGEEKDVPALVILMYLMV